MITRCWAGQMAASPIRSDASLIRLGCREVRRISVGLAATWQEQFHRLPHQRVRMGSPPSVGWALADHSWRMVDIPPGNESMRWEYAHLVWQAMEDGGAWSRSSSATG